MNWKFCSPRRRYNKMFWEQSPIIHSTNSRRRALARNVESYCTVLGSEWNVCCILTLSGRVFWSLLSQITLPVWAQAIKSREFLIMGIAYFCTGVGFAYWHSYINTTLNKINIGFISDQTSCIHEYYYELKTSQGVGKVQNKNGRR